MSPLMTWIADHLATLLIASLILGTLIGGAGAVAAWRYAKQLRTTQRPWLRFSLALVALLAGIGAIALTGSGLVKIGPGMLAQRGMLNQPAPELWFSLVETDAAGSLADFDGRVVLVNIWATWCPPCIAEMEDLDRLQTTHADAGLVVLHLSDERREKLVDWLSTRPTSATHGYARPLQWPETGRPTTYVIDRDGKVREILLGQRSYGQFEAAVMRYL
jgi:thiol-disulfide isomerase/thioredoxin